MESPSVSAVTSPSTPQTPAHPPCSHRSSSGKQPMSATLRERLRKTRFSFNSCYSVVKRLKVDDEENDQHLSEKPASSMEENCLESQRFKHKDRESKESTELENTFSSISGCDSASPVVRADSALQNELVKENLPKETLKEERTKLVKQIQEKEDLLRRLKLVKMYRSKNDLSQLQSLIKKWRSCSQLLLYELQLALSEENKKLSITQLVDHYGLDDKLIHYNRSEEDFTDA
ncbi:swi5-dependent recombination DNA repair protein 1 homolog isoform X2 [Ochotona curzoniae]|nr:swi5-dependent recombination DNA repair protein 1 homolog isoform X2 [Ochotona curzoniae]XP_040847723.1 swi5-dependent recombination DNA repair protein 1 homolog isoform X2 [Ochotona curzoniae]XP_040847724.1 swi5-dependent recombination DNA repair protein 1 homolog isoform X2 [Ochotona curzoniae]